MNQNTYVEVARIIVTLTYSEVMEMARMLAEAQENTPRDLNRTEEWAEILNSWAESVVEYSV